MFSAHLPRTPLGRVKLWATTEGIRRLDFRSGPDLALPGEELSADPLPAHLERALEALEAYFEQRIRIFSLPLDVGHVTDFQRRVWEHLQTIPYGHVTTYGEIAEALGVGDAGARAVGQAVGANPVAIVIPCHRVVGADGTLHGYSGGLERKAKLLRLEGIDVDGTEAHSKVHPEVLRLDL